MTKAIAQTYNAAYEHSMQLTFGLLAVCAFLLALYGMNVYKVIANTVALGKAQTQMAALTSSVDNLDSQYLELSSKITPDNLKDFGLTQSKVSAYISRSGSLGSVAVSGHEL